MIRCLINGEEYPLIYPFSISEKLGNNISSIIKIDVGEKAVPLAGDLVELEGNEGQTIFLGTCGIPKSPKFKSIHTPKHYTITCGNGNSILSRRLVNYATQEKTITEIVNYLYENYIAVEGISKGTISDIPITLDAYTAQDMNLQKVLNELANYVQGAWRVTNNREFNFIAKEDFTPYPETIDSNNFLGAEIQVQTKDQDLRTSQIVKGLKITTDTQTEEFTYDGEKNDFEVAFPIVQRPESIIKNGTIALTDEQIGIKGLDDNDPNVIFLFSYNSRVLSYKNNSNWLIANDEIEVKYQGQFPLRVHKYNADKISEISTKTATSGLIDHVHEDNSLTSMDDANRLANTLLELNGEARSEISFWLHSYDVYKNGKTLDSFNIGTKLNFNMPEIGLVGDYVITERTLESIMLSEEYNKSLKMKLKLKDRGFVQSYGEVFDVLVKQKKHNIREKVIVIQQEETEDTIEFQENMTAEYGTIVFWPTLEATNDPIEGLDIYPC